MNALTPHAITPHAFSARLAQLTGRGFAEYGFDTWTAFFELDTDDYAGMNERHEVCAATVAVLRGAWRDDDDTGLFCGNHDEVLAIVGQAEVARWKRHVEEMENS